MTTLFRSKSCGGLPRPKASFFHYSSSSSSNQQNDTNYEDEDEDDDICYYCQDSYTNNDYFDQNSSSPITTPFISPCQQQGGGVPNRSNHNNNFTIASILLNALRKSLLTCAVDHHDVTKADTLNIGSPTDVQHVSHVTFDRFHGFLGLPLAFQCDVPHKVPSASVCVFGVSVESMQCSYDERGNSVPTILLMMQNRLYSEGGLQAEGIFRINGENGQEEDVRKQLNRGFVPHGVDVHCLAGLIKAWFRELPTGILDSLTPEKVMHCNTEDECTRLVKTLPPTEAALLDWAINLMADVVTYDEINKMNSRNIAMVFAPNMTQMADPLTALIHAVQIMNLLKTLVIKTLREREESSPVSNQVSMSICEDSPSPSNKAEYPYTLRSATLNRLGCEDEEQFWSFPRKSGSVVEYDYISGKNSPIRCRSDHHESDDLSKHLVIDQGILERLSLRKSVMRLCRYPVFQFSKPAKKTGSVSVNATDHGEAWV
uniref:rho GTPase-activating protein 5-like n=1 Tax=Erigeron canadensis TaxID=72917 RepID=UPI001CB9736B|nr:rho GTPase-activating protein 5-like [Erigeron canadensis]